MNTDERKTVRIQAGRLYQDQAERSLGDGHRATPFWPQCMGVQQLQTSYDSQQE